MPIASGCATSPPQTKRSFPISRCAKCGSCCTAWGRQRFRDQVRLRWAENSKDSNAVQWRALLAMADAWQRPVFPLSGRDVMNAGVAEGPLVGRILGEVEQWWIDSDFIEDEFSLADRLKAVVQAIAY